MIAYFRVRVNSWNSLSVNFLWFIIAQFGRFGETFGTKFLCLQVYDMKKPQLILVGAMSKMLFPGGGG